MTTSDRDTRCGTYAGYNQHIKRRTPVCDACRHAQKEYMRWWRNKSGTDSAEAAKELPKIHSRALWELARRHREEFRHLVVEEQKKMKARDDA